MEYRGDAGDPYVDPQTDVLNNLAEIKDASHLEAFESEMSIQRQVELSEAPPPPVFDYAYLMAINRHLFQDVYSGQASRVPWTWPREAAGSDRISISKWLMPPSLPSRTTIARCGM
jgi:fido (protein-threonine AMPylation protein)